MMLRTRYVGVQPYKTRDRHLFFGRDNDIENLHDFLMLEKLVVLFGKSGYGKSSLLSAGIVPKLTDKEQPVSAQFTPVEVRFGTYIEGQSFSPLETTRRFIEQVAGEGNPNFLPNEDAERSLWLQLKRKQAEKEDQFVLIFDQFEEFFSYPLDQQEVFRKQLAELLYATLPEVVRRNLETLSTEEAKFAVQPLNVKAMLSIRSDRMSFLDTMKDVLPAILNKRYELRPLREHQAIEAIVNPAEAGHDEGASWKEVYITPPFAYTKDAIEKIIHELTSKQGGGVEAFQLQIVCAEIEKKIQLGQVLNRDENGLPDVYEGDVPNFENLYRTYYQSKLAEIPLDKLEAAQRVLEDGLLAIDQATGEGRRMSVDSQALLGQFSELGLDNDLLQQLERTYLIRREINTVGGFSYEISHDTLVGPVQKARAEREIERANRKFRRLLGASVLVAALFIGAIGFTLWALKQRDIAESALQRAEIAQDEAETERKLAETAKQEAESNLIRANQALLGMNREKLRAAEAELAKKQSSLQRFLKVFPGELKAIQEREEGVRTALKVRDRYQYIVDSLRVISKE
ncbi:MAG: hypothetical protein AAGI38_05225 [Bacteroidota bacterium]